MRDGRGDLRVLVVDAAGALEHLRKVRALSPVGTDGAIMAVLVSACVDAMIWDKMPELSSLVYTM